MLIIPPNRFPGGGGGDKLRSRVSEVTGGVRGMAPVEANRSGDESIVVGVHGGGAFLALCCWKSWSIPSRNDPDRPCVATFVSTIPLKVAKAADTADFVSDADNADCGVSPPKDCEREGASSTVDTAVADVPAAAAGAGGDGHGGCRISCSRISAS